MIETCFDEKPASYYDRIYAEGYSTAPYQPIYDAILDFIARMASPRVLEIACGTGALASQIIARGIPYRGFDFSERAISLAMRTAPSGELWVGSAYDSSNYRPLNYNLILALEVFEHLDDLKVAATLPDGMHILFSVPDFIDPAHLRVYQDMNSDIVERYKGRITVGQVLPFRFTSHSGQPLTIFLAHAVTGPGPCHSPFAANETRR